MDAGAAAAAGPWAERSTITGADGVTRCAWGVEGDPLYRAYHDAEWGRPSRDERHLFEMLVLEGAQAGLSWSTILHKREGYRRAFAGFDVSAVAAFGESDVARLLADAGIVRNRRKVEGAIANARVVLALAAAGESLRGLLWGFVEGVPLDRRPGTLAEIPAETPESRAMSRELVRRGFRFVGPTICHAFMQATGMVNDHVVGCAAGPEIRASGR
ncbi:MAG TPA: DNA-3-methyladenine glycosylase I [Candidatus Limnocylindrales bacterium]